MHFFVFSLSSFVFSVSSLFYRLIWFSCEWLCFKYKINFISNCRRYHAFCLLYDAFNLMTFSSFFPFIFFRIFLFAFNFWQKNDENEKNGNISWNKISWREQIAIQLNFYSWLNRSKCLLCLQRIFLFWQTFFTHIFLSNLYPGTFVRHSFLSFAIWRFDFVSVC